MARLSRVTPVGVPVHVIQRGNNRQVCFADEDDFACYLNWLEMYSTKYQVVIHAWVLMTNHVHLLCTPNAEGAISLMMQSLGRQYVRYFNQKYQRSGTLWEGRFRSCLIESEVYLLTVYKYIELNPVRAKMVTSPAEYNWSSYKMNALGYEYNVGTPAELYLQLGATKSARNQNYQMLFDDDLSNLLVDEIRDATNKGLAFGNQKFKDEIEVLTGRRVSHGKRGRPVIKKSDN